jgi:hypothetical protein
MGRQIPFPALALVALIATAVPVSVPADDGQAGGTEATGDLDAFMRQVLARRDDNWKKLQQYVLDEREAIDLHGPGRTLIWGERRDYTWFIREGFFVRSPVKVNGVTIGEADRRKYEATYLRREQERERRRARGQQANGDSGSPGSAAGGADPGSPGGRGGPGASPPGDPTREMDAVLRQTREPQFISSAYFLRFRFEEGKYALVGRERVTGLQGTSGALETAGTPATAVTPGTPATAGTPGPAATGDGLETLRIEYYPARLFGGTDRRRNGRGQAPGDAASRAYDAEFQRLINKSSLVTLWVEPKAHQIVKYTFDNVAFDFLPAQWLVHVDDVHATMTMGQMFPGVWLPQALEVQAAMTLAAGQFDVHYGLDYHDYRRADVTTKVAVPKGR